jgi:hypothetical protein
MPEFVLQFPLDRVREYAGRYAYEDDTAVLAIGRGARERGYYTLDEFVTVCPWKTPRSAPLVALDTAQAVEAATRTALRAAATERERMKALRFLNGVDWATASVFLHLAYPERYPILDVRALHALGVEAPAAYSFRYWDAYVSPRRSGSPDRPWAELTGGPLYQAAAAAAADAGYRVTGRQLRRSGRPKNLWANYSRFYVHELPCLRDSLSEYAATLIPGEHLRPISEQALRERLAQSDARAGGASGVLWAASDDRSRERRPSPAAAANGQPRGRRRRFATAA